MATLTSTTPAATYKSLLKVQGTNQVLDSTLRVIEDGDGNDSSLKLTLTGSTYGASFVGKVGIGTDSPGQKLEVNGSGDTRIELESTDAVSTLNMRGVLSGSDGVFSGITFFNDADSVAIIQAHRDSYDTSGRLVFGTEAGSGIIEHMVLDKDGNVGIGTATPSYLLSTQHATDASVYIETTGADSVARLRLENDARTWQVVVDGTDSDKFKIRDSVASAYRFTIDSSGNVGIGTTAPESDLSFSAAEINNSRIRFINQHSVTGDAGISTFDDTSGTELIIGSNCYINSGGSVVRWNTGEESSALYLSRHGNVQFQTSTDGVNPTTKMKVEAGGDVEISAGNLVIGTSGKGIDFSATSDAGGMTSELLDDYEEGTFTFQFYDAASAGNASPTTNIGHYTKIGNVVVARVYAYNNPSTSGMTSGNDLYFTLPFTAGADGYATGACIVRGVDLNSRTSIATDLRGSASRGTFQTIGDGLDMANVLVSHWTSESDDLNMLTLTYAT